MNSRMCERRPYHVEPGAGLAGFREGGEVIDAQSVVQRERLCQLPLILQIDAFDPFCLRAIVDDGPRYVGRLQAGNRIGWQHLGGRHAGRLIALQVQAGAQCVRVTQLVGAIRLPCIGHVPLEGIR